MYGPEATTPRPPKEIWDIARSQLRLQLPRSTYETWVRDTTCLACEDGAFVIGVANAYAKEWLSLRLRPLIKRALAGIIGQAVDVTFIVQPVRLADAPDAAPVPLLAYERVADDGAGREDIAGEVCADEVASREVASREVAAREVAAREVAAREVASREVAADEFRMFDPTSLHGANLNPRYTFENFIVGSSNRMAHAVAQSVAERPGTAYNPLFIYGGSGLGKTHLLQAIGRVVQAAGKRALYVTSEVFTNEMIGAIRTQTTDAFRAKYRTIDVLLLDDIHFIGGKEQTQEEFFHTFNALHASNRQIVLTSDRPPQAISTLEDRLRSRFGWGMIADIQPPNLETRIAILQTKAATMGHRVPDDVLTLIAQRAHKNIRDLEGALTRVLAHAELFKRPLNAALVEDALAYLMPAQTKLTPETIMEIAADYFGIAVSDLINRGRSAPIALQRQIVMYLIREETGMSLPQIGLLLGGRDHTTVMHGIEKIAADLAKDADLSRAVSELRTRLYEPIPVRAR
jgi:chromosomal replication initiator protein